MKQNNYQFLGLHEKCATPHLLEHFTKNKIYQLTKPRSPYRIAINDIDQTVMISNTMLRQFFRKINDKF
jgi:hypothetical protein